MWLGTRREPGRAGAKPGGAGRGGGPFAAGKKKKKKRTKREIIYSPQKDSELKKGLTGTSSVFFIVREAIRSLLHPSAAVTSVK